MLEFRDVSLRSPAHHMTGLDGVSFALMPGEAMLVQVQEGREHTPLPDMAQGLLLPERGEVLFRGQAWSAMSPRVQSARRGAMRRVFERYGWITNLDIIENICLAESHHTQRPLREIQAEAERVARQFGLDRIPDGRPARAHAMTLRKLEWVRAFLGTPDMIILERPLMGAPRGDASRLLEAVLAACQRGAAVLWLTDDERCPGGVTWEKRRRYCLRGERLEAA